MTFPFVIDNQEHRLANALNGLLAQSAGKPLDIATAYFALSGYRLLGEGLHQVGAFRVLPGAEAHSGAVVGLPPAGRALLLSTRPVRDPLDVLEAKIRSGTERSDWTKPPAWPRGGKSKS